MAEEKVEIDSFKVEYRLDATVTVNGNSWVKPGVTSSVGWRGLPEAEQVALASKYLVKEVVEPLLDDVLQTVIERTLEAEGLGSQNVTLGPNN